MKRQSYFTLLIVSVICCQVSFGSVATGLAKNLAKQIGINAYANYVLSTWFKTVETGEITHSFSDPAIEGFFTGADVIPGLSEVIDLLTIEKGLSAAFDTRTSMAANAAAEQRIEELIAARNVVVGNGTNLQSADEAEMRAIRAAWLTKAFYDLKKAKEEWDRVNALDDGLHGDEIIMKQMLRSYWNQQIKMGQAELDRLRVPGDVTPQWTEEMLQAQREWEAVNQLDSDDLKAMKEQLNRIAEEKLQATILAGQFVASKIGMSGVDFREIKVGSAEENDQAQKVVAVLFLGGDSEKALEIIEQAKRDAEAFEAKEKERLKALEDKAKADAAARENKAKADALKKDALLKEVAAKMKLNPPKPPVSNASGPVSMKPKPEPQPKPKKVVQVKKPIPTVSPVPKP